jgi:glutamate synthase (NADPH/NADH) large chain
MTSYKEKQGLYDVANEHDSCGIGFVAHIKGEKSFDIIKRGLEVLERMEHRGAEGADNKTGDGSGIMIQIPHEYYRELVPGLPESGAYVTGLVFLPSSDTGDAEACAAELERIIENEGQRIIAWRDIKTDNTGIGNIAKASEPLVRQIFITGKSDQHQDILERKAYLIRKQTESGIRDSSIRNRQAFYIPSLSSKTIVYKGMLTPHQVKLYYPELTDRRMKSAMALVHSRFSTTTFPSWDLAQPFRILAHNGEINTVKGNRFWMQAREADFESEIFGEDIRKILPVIDPGKSDSASFDNALEMLVATGRSLPHAIMMLIPESWNDKNPIPEDLKYFYEYHSTFMEPWDGPASMVFTDGRYIGGTLDRNGLRPSRYIITKDDMIVMGSEVGVQTFEPEQIAFKGRLLPGKLLLVDTLEGRIIPDEEIKNTIAHQKPYRKWVQDHRVVISDIEFHGEAPVEIPEKKLHEMHLMHGYNREDINELIIPMITTAQEPVSSMGTDTPIALFSERPQRLFNYFKQTFAQVTNPAIDPIREELVMTLTSYIGSEKNLLSEKEDHCTMIKYYRPVFTNRELESLRQIKNPDFRSATLDILFPANEGEEALAAAMENLCKTAEELIDRGVNFLILSDRKAGADRAPIPSLLAAAGIHHHLIRARKRKRCGILLESAEPREVMHFVLLFAYGVSAVNPYGVFATIDSLKKKGLVPADLSYQNMEENFIKAIDKGLLKVLSKMGTSTLRSYRGAQIVEALGLSQS